MEYREVPRRHGSFIKFLSDFRALFIKTFLLTTRKPGQTIAEILLAYTFMGFLLGMRYILDRRSYSAYEISRFRPQDTLVTNGIGNITYYYPGNICAQTIVENAVNDLIARWPNLSPNVQAISDPTLSTLSSTALQSIIAFIYFTNLDSCTSPSTMPDQVTYTLRMQENGANYYHAQYIKLSPNDYLWKRSPEDFCRDTSSINDYLNQFVGMQYSIDMSIIEYATNLSQNLTSNIFLNHFGCPPVNIDQLHSIYGFFIPIFFSIIFVITFIINVGYIVEERENKTKEYLRIYGLHTWVNNLVWVTRSMLIYFVLIGVVTGLSMLVFPSTGFRSNSISRRLFNYTNWTVIWTILFVYSIQVSAFSVLFGQFFKRPLLAKLFGFIVWVLTFIDYYPGVPVGVRYFLCLFPNAALLFCLEVVLQYERKNNAVTFRQLYSNLFSYQLYIGVCLVLMLIYSVIYLLLAMYVERIYPGEFGVAQSWNYIFKKSYWKPQATSTVRPLNDDEKPANENSGNSRGDNWIELKSMTSMKNPSLTVSHLTKKFGKFCAVSDLSLNFYKGEVSSLLGHNGAGKTTTTFILVGMLEPTSGYVTVEGLDNRIHIQDVRKILGFCPQYDILYNELSVQEHLELMGKMRHMEPEMLRESIETVLHLIGLVNDRQTLSKNLSGGMKRRLSIGISLIGDPKVLILDEPTSGIDPYNRRLIWTIIRKMKEAGKCIILTTHFLEEADVLSDRIAIMTSGRLQANGTPDFLKNQIEFEYRLFIDKQDICENERITSFIQKHIPDIVLERESLLGMVFGIRRSESKQIGQLIHALEKESGNIGVQSFGLSMTTIEEVFLKLIREAEEEALIQNRSKSRQELADKVFSANYEREKGARRFWFCIFALLVKRWHVLRRQYIFLLGFFFLPMLVEILIVSVLPSPQQIQASLAQNGRVANAEVTLLPSIYNPHTIVTYSDNNENNVETVLTDYIQNTGATLVEISTDTVSDYVVDRYLASEDIFISTYQMGFAAYNNLTSSVPSLVFNSYFSTVNYHTMATSLSVASTNLFRFYANSSDKMIITTNQPILTTSNLYSFSDLFFEIIYCFDTIPLSLFNFLNSIVGSLFISMLIVPLIHERISHSKDLQLLTNLTKRSYWFANTIFDLSLCFILCSLITIIVKIGSASNPNTQAEVYIYINTAQAGYFFLMFMMYSLASLPLLYVFSFAPKSELIGFIAYFIINIIGLFFDMILAFISVYSQVQAVNATSTTKLANTMISMGWFLVVVFPSVNLKRALFNIRLKSNPTCISQLNGLYFLNYSSTGPWMALPIPGLGAMFIIFCGQIILWWTVLILIENGANIKLGCRRYCNRDLGQIDNKKQQTNYNKRAYRLPSLTNVSVNGQLPSTNPWNKYNGLPQITSQRNVVEKKVPPVSSSWNDAHLDEDVRNERQSILEEDSSTTSSVILVRDLVQRFKKRKEKSLFRRIYTAVDHLNFRVAKRSCFGANGAGKTTTFRMLINDLKPTSGEIFINGKNIHKMKRDLEIGFCPQFDWLIDKLSVIETLTLFARLKGIKWSEIPQICDDMIDLFGLEAYRKRIIEKLSGGNKRKVSALLAFVANPELVFLDEPTTGLDAAAKRKLWDVIRAARDVGLTIIMTSHSMEECEALCTKIGIMKLGQFVCLGNLQRLKNRFGHGYAVRIKLPLQDINTFKEELMLTLPGVQIQEQHNGVLFCSVPFSSSNTSQRATSGHFMSLSHVFEWFNKKKEEKSIESYSITQTTLEQIFVQVAGDEQEMNTDENKKK